MPKKVLIALPPAMLQEVDFIAQEEHRTRSDLIRESLRRYINSFKRNGPGPVLRVAEPVDDDHSHGTAPLMVALLVAFALACAPVMAADESQAVLLRGPILTMPDHAPVLGQTADDWDHVPTYAEKHPIVMAGPIKLWAGVKKTAKITRTQWIGQVMKKTGVAFSDAFIVFGKKTEPYHPGMQTLGYAGAVLVPILGVRSSK